MLGSYGNIVICLLVCCTKGLYGQDGCGGNVNATMDVSSLTSPGFPRQYENNMDCTYLITAPVGERVYLTTSSNVGIGLEESHFCEKDFVLVVDGPSPTGPIVTKSCKFPVSVLSTGRYLTIVFHSDDKITSTGFHLLYRTVIESEACPLQILNAYNTSYITSPFYPMDYPNNTECEIRLIAPQEYVVYIETKVSSLEKSERCQKDYVQVYDAAHKGGGFTLRKWCGTDLPKPIHTPGIFMTIIFHSDDEISDTGFRIEYSARLKSDFVQPHEKNDRGLVVGVVVGVIVLVVLLVIVGAVCLIQKRKSARSHRMMYNE